MKADLRNTLPAQKQGDEEKFILVFMYIHNVPSQQKQKPVTPYCTHFHAYT
jgi:hypothetical protein